MNSVAVGIDLGGTKIAAALVDSKGTIIDLARQPTDVSGGPRAVLMQIVEMVKDIMPAASVFPKALGIGVAGQIEADTGVVRFAPNLKWRNVPLQSELQEALGMPVVITNDVRAITWGEWLFGAGKGNNNLICVFVGTGIGGGLVLNGRVWNGCGNTAGEIGHITVNLEGPECTCGNRGCMEALAGGWAIARLAKEAISSDPVSGSILLELAGNELDKITAEVVAHAYHGGDPLARKLIDQAGEALGAGIASLVNAFNPCLIILGGGVIQGIPELMDKAERGIAKRALPVASSVLKIVKAELGKDAGVVGAAAMAMRAA